MRPVVPYEPFVQLTQAQAQAQALTRGAVAGEAERTEQYVLDSSARTSTLWGSSEQIPKSKAWLAVGGTVSSKISSDFKSRPWACSLSQ